MKCVEDGDRHVVYLYNYDKLETVMDTSLNFFSFYEKDFIQVSHFLYIMMEKNEHYYGLFYL